VSDPSDARAATVLVAFLLTAATVPLFVLGSLWTLPVAAGAVVCWLAGVSE
jgi:hypothetical protein